MKKIISFVLMLFVLYIVSIFAFPKVSWDIAEKLWIQEFNNTVVLIKTNIENFVLNYDVDATITEASERLNQLKTMVDDSIKWTQDIIDDIRWGVTSVEESYLMIKKSIDDTTEMIEGLRWLLNMWELTDEQAKDALEEIEELEKQLIELKDLEWEIR